MTNGIMQNLTSVARCDGCGYGIALDGRVDRTTCRHCDKIVHLKWVVGEVNGKIPCDGRCQYAIGRFCSCSCGGNNHGRGYIDFTLVPQPIREADFTAHRDKLARAAAKGAAVRKQREEARADLLEQHPILVDLNEFSEEYGFLADMYRCLEKGEFSERQLAATLRTLEQNRQRFAQQQQREQRHEELVAAGVALPTGRITFTGTVASVRVDQGYPRTTYRMKVESSDGWSVWGTCPKALYAQVENLNQLRGRSITLTATLAPSNDDPLFGFMSRPTLVELHDNTKESVDVS